MAVSSWPHSVVVSTLDSGAGGRGSIPRGANSLLGERAYEPQSSRTKKLLPKGRDVIRAQIVAVSSWPHSVVVSTLDS